MRTAKAPCQVSLSHTHNQYCKFGTHFTLRPMNRIAEPDLPAEAIHGCLELLPSMSWLLDMGTAGVEVETPRHLTNPNRMRPRWSSSQVLHPSCHVEHVWGKATSKNRRSLTPSRGRSRVLQESMSSRSAEGNRSTVQMGRVHGVEERGSTCRKV